MEVFDSREETKCSSETRFENGESRANPVRGQQQQRLLGRLPQIDALLDGRSLVARVTYEYQNSSVFKVLQSPLDSSN